MNLIAIPVADGTALVNPAHVCAIRPQGDQTIILLDGGHAVYSSLGFDDVAALFAAP